MMYMGGSPRILRDFCDKKTIDSHSDHVDFLLKSPGSNILGVMTDQSAIIADILSTSSNLDRMQIDDTPSRPLSPKRSRFTDALMDDAFKPDKKPIVPRWNRVPVLEVDNVSPKSSPMKISPLRGPLRVANSSPRSSDGSISKGKQPARATPILQPHTGMMFVNQDGQPITIGPKKDDTDSDDPSDPFKTPAFLVPNSASVYSPTMPPTPSKAGPPKAMPAQAEARKPSDAGSTPDQQQRHPSEDYLSYQDLKPDIEKLLTEGLWRDRPLSDFTIEKLKGGSFNRIVSVTVAEPTPTASHAESSKDKFKRKMLKMRSKPSSGDLERYSKFATTYSSGDYILRIPRLFRSRHANYNFQADFITHDFVQDLGVDCPKIVAFQERDMSENALIQFPYLLQEKVKGKRLDDLYPMLIHQQRLQVAKQMGQICKKMTIRNFSFYGKLFNLGPVYLDENSKITRDETFMEPHWVDPRGATEGITAAQVLTFGYLHHMRNPRWSMPVPWEQLMALVQRLDVAGAFGQEGWYFTHGDMFPRNIMVDIDSEGDAQITSVLDWDMASFQPAVEACKAPAWLWHWKYYNCRDEDILDLMACVEPEDIPSREIKKAFDEAAGSWYVQNAYHKHAWLARKLCSWNWHGHDRILGHYWPIFLRWFDQIYDQYADMIAKGNFEGVDRMLRARWFPSRNDAITVSS